MATKLGKVVKYHENLPFIKLIDLSINSSCMILQRRMTMNTLYIYLCYTNDHQQTWQGDDSSWGHV